jgi:hypothetical protein
MVDMMANDTSGRTAMMTGNSGPPLDFGQKVKDAVKALREACPEEHFMAGTYEFLYSCALSTLSLECQSMSHQSCSYPLETTGCLLVDRINELNSVLEADANISFKTENFSLALLKWLEKREKFLLHKIQYPYSCATLLQFSWCLTKLISNPHKLFISSQSPPPTFLSPDHHRDRQANEKEI